MNNYRRSFHSLGAVSGDMGENQMTVDELKAELDMRGVNFDDCISKNELVDRLVATRVSGKANPEILKQFNNMQSDEPDSMSSSVFDDKDIVGKVQAKDGSLPVSDVPIHPFTCNLKTPSAVSKHCNVPYPSQDG